CHTRPTGSRRYSRQGCLRYGGSCSWLLDLRFLLRLRRFDLRPRRRAPDEELPPTPRSDTIPVRIPKHSARRSSSKWEVHHWLFVSRIPHRQLALIAG